MSLEGSGASRVLSILQSKGLHAGPQYDGNSSPTCLHDSYSVFNPPLVDCSQEIRCPQVNVPAPSVTGVFQTVLVQVEHPQYETSWEGEGFNVGAFVGFEVVGCILGRDDS